MFDWLFGFGKKGGKKGAIARKGAMELEEIVKIVIAVVVLVLLAAGVWLLFKGKGGELLGAIKNLLHIGKA